MGCEVSEREPRGFGVGDVIIVFVACLYVLTLFMLYPWAHQPLAAMTDVRMWALGVVERTLKSLGGLSSVSLLTRHGAFLLVFSGLIPLGAMAALGRGRPRDFGLRIPNVFGWRLILVGFAVALPLVVWMTGGARFPGMYLSHFKRYGAAVFLGYNFVNIATEHLFHHGILLTLLRPGHCWPTSIPRDAVGGNRRQRILRWIGLAQATSDAAPGRRTVRWLGIPPGCLFAMVLSSLLFASVHFGKDARELLLSIPGGFGLAYLAYRCDSLLVPFALHALTAGAAFLLVLFRHGA